MHKYISICGFLHKQYVTLERIVIINKLWNSIWQRGIYVNHPASANYKTMIVWDWLSLGMKSLDETQVEGIITPCNVVVGLFREPVIGRWKHHVNSVFYCGLSYRERVHHYKKTKANKTMHLNEDRHASSNKMGRRLSPVSMEHYQSF